MPIDYSIYINNPDLLPNAAFLQNLDFDLNNVNGRSVQVIRTQYDTILDNQRRAAYAHYYPKAVKLFIAIASVFLANMVFWIGANFYNREWVWTQRSTLPYRIIDNPFTFVIFTIFCAVMGTWHETIKSRDDAALRQWQQQNSNELGLIKNYYKSWETRHEVLDEPIKYFEAHKTPANEANIKKCNDILMQVVRRISRSQSAISNLTNHDSIWLRTLV